MVKANVQVKSEGGTLPSSERLAQAAYLLSAHGFQVLRTGRLGLLVEADAQRFRDVLGVTVGHDATSAPVHLADFALGALVQRVESLPEPAPPMP